MTQAHECLAHGSHAGWNWFIERVPDLAPSLLLVIVQGRDKPGWVTRHYEVPDATPEDACALVDRVIAELAAKAARVSRRR
jgi:hypothetical protein